MRAEDRRAGLVRLVAWTALAALCALEWSAQVEPASRLPAFTAVAAGALAGALLLGRRPGGRVLLPSAGLAVGATLVAVAASGLELRLLLPWEWDALVRELRPGFEALPSVAVPYDGADDATRLAMILAGSLATVVSALLAFLPRRGGLRLVAAAPLLALYGVHAAEQPSGSPALSGALLGALLLGFLWADRVRGAQAPLAGALAAASVLVAALALPAVDRDGPLIDYEQLVASAPPEGTSAFDWSHRYGPLDWPRDGRVVLRVTARRAAYWKATVLQEFDGTAWTEGRRSDPSVRATEYADGRRVTDVVRVEVGDMVSDEYVAAGTATRIVGSPRLSLPAGAGTFRTGTRPLERGDSYRAEVYVARPSRARLRAAGTAYPDFALRDLTMRLPGGGEVLFTPWGAAVEPVYGLTAGLPSPGGDERVERSSYARMYRLARSLRAVSRDPHDFVLRVRARVQRGATYSEQPPRRRNPLDAFLFETRVGYCQQFSGAMALLLRMGGVPARVATGFSTGERDRDSGQWIVRDTDAHSWVEAYFPGEGWVTFDPTPDEAPAITADEREAPEEAAGEDPAARDEQEEEDAGEPVDEAVEAPASISDDGGGGGGALAVVLAALALLLAAGASRAVRREADEDTAIAELRRALVRMGEDAGPSTTLEALERRFAGAPPAAAYLAALRARRYGADPAQASPQGRAALRRALARGRGARGLLRSWWALPPRAAGRRRVRRQPSVHSVEVR